MLQTLPTRFFELMTKDWHVIAYISRVSVTIRPPILLANRYFLAAKLLFFGPGIVTGDLQFAGWTAKKSNSNSI